MLCSLKSENNLINTKAEVKEFTHIFKNLKLNKKLFRCVADNKGQPQTMSTPGVNSVGLILQ